MIQPGKNFVSLELTSSVLSCLPITGTSRKFASGADPLECTGRVGQDGGTWRALAWFCSRPGAVGGRKRYRRVTCEVRGLGAHVPRRYGACSLVQVLGRRAHLGRVFPWGAVAAFAFIPAPKQTRHTLRGRLHSYSPVLPVVCFYKKYVVALPIPKSTRSVCHGSGRHPGGRGTARRRLQGARGGARPFCRLQPRGLMVGRGLGPGLAPFSAVTGRPGTHLQLTEDTGRARRAGIRGRARWRIGGPRRARARWERGGRGLPAVGTRSCSGPPSASARPRPAGGAPAPCSHPHGPPPARAPLLPRSWEKGVTLGVGGWGEARGRGQSPAVGDGE